MNKTIKFLTTLLLLAVSVGTWAEDKWVKTSITDLATNDIVVIVDETSSMAMSNDKGTSAAPTATSVTLSADKSEITSTVAAKLQWEVEVLTNTYRFAIFNETNHFYNCLYCTNSNNGVRVGTNANNQFSWDSSTNKLKHTTTNRWIGVYSDQDWRCYTSSDGNIVNTKTVFYKLVSESSSSAVATTTNIDDSGITNTDVYAGTAAGTLIATVKAGDTTIEGATVNWSSSNTSVATIDENGAITLVAAGTATITASYAGVTDQYQASYATYELTVTNSEPVIDYATLPFNWAGGAKADFLALTGVTAEGLGSDYAEGNAPYRIKLDNTGDYIQVKTDSQPGKVTIGVKMIGGNTPSTITVQGSADGETFTDVQELTISGAQNAELTLETTNSFAATDRYVRLLFTKGSNVGVGPITIAKPSNTPEIVASNVELTYDATSGSISYSINNTVEGGTLAASTEASWLTLGNETTSPISFNCSANSETTARTATVTLTYTYNTNETVTKDIIVTQAGNPNVVNNISDITAVNENYAIRGTVVAKSNRGLVIGDGTGYVLYYNQNYSQSDYNVGDMVKMSGTMGSYNHVYQFTSTATIETSETSNYNNTPAVQVLDATAIAAYSENLHLSDYVQLEGTLVKSGNYYNLQVEGLETDASISYPTTEQAKELDALENEIVIVKGYFGGVASNHFNVILESIEEKVLLDNAINGLEDAYTIDMTQDEYDLTFNATATSGATVLYEVISEVTTLTEDDYVLEGNELMVSKRGTIVIRAYVAADDEYKAAEKVITVTVLGAKDEAVVAVLDKTLECGGSYTLVENDDYQTDGEITMTSSNPLVASVDGLTVTAAAVGTATITVNAAEGTNYAALVTPATFTVTVTSPIGLEEAPSTEAVVLLNESFSESTGSLTEFGGNDGNGTIKYDGSEWFVSKAYGANGSAKFGTSSNKGSATTPELTVVSGETYNLTFKAAPWASESTTMNITVEGGTITGVSTDAMTTGEWNEYSATITASSTSMSVTFEASNKRFFLDDVKIEKPAEAVVAPKLTLSASGYASYCCEYPLDFTNIDKDTFKAWYVSAVDMTSGDVTFSEITGTIKGGEAFFLYGTPGAECQLAYAESSSVVLNGNKLVGTLAPTYVENGNGIQNYGLSGGNFVKMGNGVVKANKSYLPVEVGTETPTRLNIIFESQEATGIMNVSREGTTDNRYYNLNGQRVMNPTKGMYIVNGKKVIIK